MAAAGSNDAQGSAFANVPVGYRPAPWLRPENDPRTYQPADEPGAEPPNEEGLVAGLVKQAGNKPGVAQQVPPFASPL
eukprot:6203298-Alexandrium_andersonii.AAC.1